MHRLQPLPTTLPTQALAIIVAALVHIAIVMVVSNITIPKVELPTRTKFVTVSFAPTEITEVKPTPIPASAPSPLTPSPAASTTPATPADAVVKPQPAATAAKPTVTNSKRASVNKIATPVTTGAITPTPTKRPGPKPPTKTTSPPQHIASNPENTASAMEKKRIANALAEEARKAKEEAETKEKLRQEETAKTLATEIKKQKDAEIKRIAEKYRDQIREGITAAWELNTSLITNSNTVSVRITLRANGVLNSVVIVKSSGNNEIDASASAAIHKAAPFAMPENPEVHNKHLRILEITLNPNLVQR